jgi:hypothetical protein
MLDPAIAVLAQKVWLAEPRHLRYNEPEAEQVRGETRTIRCMYGGDASSAASDWSRACLQPAQGRHATLLARRSPGQVLARKGE